MKKEVETRPLDRPVKVYCRVCKRYSVDNWTNKGKPCKKPVTLKNSSCSNCQLTGTMVFHEIEATPVCGDPECKGTCSNILCYPKDEIKIEVEKSTGTYIPYIIAYSVFLIGVGIVIGYYAI